MHYDRADFRVAVGVWKLAKEFKELPLISQARPALSAVAAAILLIALAACSKTPPQQQGAKGDDGYTHFGTPLHGGAVAPAVNPFLWRAALEIVSFMPLASADSTGGVLITDWYAPPETPNERFKANVFVTSRQLRPDALRVVMFKQTRNAQGTWADATIEPSVARGLEDSILARGRQLRAEAPQQ